MTEMGAKTYQSGCVITLQLLGYSCLGLDPLYFTEKKKLKCKTRDQGESRKVITPGIMQ